MGKKGSWFSAVKKAFSPSKDGDKEGRSTKEPQKNPTKEKKRWNFGRASQQETSVDATRTGKLPALPEKPFSPVDAEQNKHAMAVAVATAAAAEAAVAAAQAAAEVVRLTGAARGSFYGGWSREERAAVKIQAAFRGYLARRALRALKGLVRLQALVRGHTVRRQATITLRCMQALVRVQARVRARRARLSEEREVAQRELWQKQQREAASRRSLSDASHQDDWDDRVHSAEDAQNKLQVKQEAELRRERALAYAYSHQLWKAAPESEALLFASEQDKSHWGWSWLERWMAGRTWDDSIDKDVPVVSSVKSLEEIPVDIGHRSASTKIRAPPVAPGRMSPAISTTVSKPLKQPVHIQSPTAPLPSKPVPNNARSASPRSTRTLDEDISAVSVARSAPALVSAPQRFSSRQSVASSSVRDDESLVSFPAVPSYMAPTQSAKAKARSQSTPKQRPGTPEKEHLSSAKKRLSFPLTESFIGTSGPLKSSRPPGPQRSPSLRGHSGPLKFERSFNEATIESIASLNGDVRRHFK